MAGPAASGGEAAARGAWNSKMGFLMASIGAAVGLGNLVLFPYRTATNGGATFVLVYIVMVLVVGLPTLLAEMAIGRRFRLNPLGAYREAGVEGRRQRGHAFGGQRAKWIGVVAIATSMLLLSYYSVITGWALDYFLRAFDGAYFADPGAYFNDVGQGPYALFLHLLVMAGLVAIVARGVSQGIEKAVTIMIPVLFAVIIGVTIYGLFGSGAGDGLRFYLQPDLSELNAGSVLDAAGQVFFSIGVGFGLMVTYASYMARDSDIVADGTFISVGDFLVALMGGLMIFPLVFSFGIQESDLSASSIGMLFQVVPNIFRSMGGLANIFAGIFFLAIMFAAISSALALLEVAVATVVDEWGIPRWKAAIIGGLFAYTLGIGSAISLDFLGRADALMSNVFLIISGIALSLFAGWFLPSMANDIDAGARYRVGTFTVWMLRVVVPLVLVVTFVLAFEGTVDAIFG